MKGKKKSQTGERGGNGVGPPMPGIGEFLCFLSVLLLMFPNAPTLRLVLLAEIDSGGGILNLVDRHPG